MERKMAKFVPYYRVSTDKQGRSGLGLEAQQEIVRRHLGQRDKVLLAPFVEIESGRKSDRERPELAKALAHCRAHKATLIVAKMDRLFRNARFLMELVDSGVDVVFCDFPQIPQGAAGRFMLQTLAASAEMEAGLISERTKAALKAKVARDGQWDRNAAHHLVPGAGQAKATAAVVFRATRTAQDLAGVIDAIKTKGISSATGIARELNEQGITTARGGQWQAVQVQRVLARLAA
jgi:DNA invertase Pin-like site-specific DNA recombinase